MRITKYGVIGDAHGGFKAYGSTRRTEEAVCQLSLAVDMLADEDVIIFVGDLFDDTSITNWVKKEIIAIKERRPNQRWIIDGGNHDSTKTYSSTSALDVFGEINNVQVINKFEPEEIDGMLFVPHHKSQTAFLSSLDRIIAEGKKYEAIIMHCMVASTLDLSPNDLNLDMFRLGELSKLCTFMWLGHEHAPMQYGKNTFMAGAILEFDFSQLGPKYVYSVDGECMSKMHLPQPRKMFKVEVPWNGPIPLLEFLRTLDPSCIYKLEIGPVPLSEYSAAKNVVDIFEAEYEGDAIFDISKLGHKEIKFTAIDASFNLREELLSFTTANGIPFADRMTLMLEDALSQVAATEEDV